MCGWGVRLGVCAGWRGWVCSWGVRLGVWLGVRLGEVGCVAGCVVGCVAGFVVGCVCWVEGLGGERSASAVADGARSSDAIRGSAEVKFSRLISCRYQCK